MLFIDSASSDAEVGAELERGCGGEPSFLYNVSEGLGGLRQDVTEKDRSSNVFLEAQKWVGSSSSPCREHPRQGCHLF
jgi:hypothetical protein